MSNDDQKIIDLIFCKLRNGCKNGFLKGLIRKNFELPYKHIISLNEMDIILKTGRNTLFIIEVKTRQQRSNPVEKYNECISQLKKDEKYIKRYYQEYQDCFNGFKKIVYSFVYFVKSTKGKDEKSGFYVLRQDPSKVKEIKKASDIIKYALFIKWDSFVKNAWNTVSKY